jgi:hypothetical protein
MNDADSYSSSAVDISAPSRRWRVPPAIALLLLSPIMVNLLFGSIRITNPFALLPATLGWGCGTLIIRELARRHGLGWPAIMLLGLSLAVLEECVILQTSFAPLIGVDPNHVFGRAFGVNWPYFLWALGHEVVLAVGVPILLVELFYPERRHQSWLGNKGLVFCSVVFVLGAVLTWYGWTQIFMPKFFPQSALGVAPSSIVIALTAAVVFATIALKSRSFFGREILAATPPRVWQLGAAALAVGIVWSALLFLAYGAVPRLPAAIPLAIGVAMAAAAVVAVSRWSARAGWTDLHSLALALGALAAAMLAGFALLWISGAGRVDHVGKLLLDAVAMFVLVRLGLKLGSASAA